MQSDKKPFQSPTMTREEARWALQELGFYVGKVEIKVNLRDLICNSSAPDYALLAITAGELKEALRGKQLSITEQAFRKATKKDIDRFLSHILPKDENGCMIWDIVENSNGYGKFKLGVTTILAHRFRLFLYHQEKGIPWNPNLQVLHSLECKNKLCCNPEHLRQGTAKENGEDYSIACYRRRAAKD